MGPVELYGMTGMPFESLAAPESAVDDYRGLGTATRAAVHVVATATAATLVLGLFPEYGTRTIERTRRSPIISACIGLPGVLLLGALLYAGSALGATTVGVVFAVPLVTIGVTLLPAWTALGFASIGATVASRLGSDRLPVQVGVGSLLSALVVVEPVGLVLAGLAGTLGTGAGARVLVTRGWRNAERERVVPPSNKI